MKTSITVHIEWTHGSEQHGIDAAKAAITKGLEKFMPDFLKPIDFQLQEQVEE